MFSNHWFWSTYYDSQHWKELSLVVWSIIYCYISEELRPTSWHLAAVDKLTILSFFLHSWSGIPKQPLNSWGCCETIFINILCIYYILRWLESPHWKAHAGMNTYLIRARVQCCAVSCAVLCTGVESVKWGKPKQCLPWPALSSLGAELERILCYLVFAP